MRSLDTLGMTDARRLGSVPVTSVPVTVPSGPVYQWEHKAGALKFRGESKARVLALRGIGAREAKRLLSKE